MRNTTEFVKSFDSSIFFKENTQIEYDTWIGQLTVSKRKTISKFIYCSLKLQLAQFFDIFLKMQQRSIVILLQGIKYRPRFPVPRLPNISCTNTHGTHTFGRFSFHAGRVSKPRVTGPQCLAKIYRFLETSVTVDVAFPPLIRTPVSAGSIVRGS